MTKAFSYLRVSGLAQVTGDGFDRQRESITQYAAEHKLTLTQEFRDEGVAGKREAFDRPALNQLFGVVRSEGADIVLVERSDRLARDLMVGEIILTEFRKLKVRVIETEGGNDLTVEDGEPTKVLIRQILGAIAQFEKTVLVQKMMAAKIRIRARGERCEGGKPFGSLGGEDAIVRKIKQFSADGQTAKQIAEVLNLSGVAPRTPGARWHETSVRRILRRAA